MATYKVIQDIEAEDKLLGPFGLRQFIYLIIVAVSGFIIFRLFFVSWFLVIPLLPHTIFFAMLALPIGGDQPTETWLLAKIRFMLKPRRRVWDQAGMKELVTITAPKKEEKVLTDQLSEGEVRSRLEALANTIDSRGWAIKNVNVNMFNYPAYAGAGSNSDRLVDINSFSMQQSDEESADYVDMFDENNNPRLQNINSKIDQSAQSHRDKIIQNMKSQSGGSQNQPQPTSNQPSQTPQTSGHSPQPGYWFTSNSNNQANQSNIITPDPSAANDSNSGLTLSPLAPLAGPLSEEELLDKIHTEKKHQPKSYGNMKVIKTLAEQKAEEEERVRLEAEKARQQAMTPAPDPDIIELARNDDLDLETVSRQAKKSKKKDTGDGEVVINLH